MTASTPRVSILMAVHNGARSLELSLASIVTQTFSDLEIVVVDDGSEDDTPTILGRWSDDRLRIVRQRRTGLTRALNHGLAMTRGEFVARLDADDVSAPERIERQVRHFEVDPNIALLGSWALIVDDQERVLEVARPPIDDAAIRAQLLWDNSFFHSTLMFRRDTILKLGGYDETVERAQDYDLVWRVSRIGRLANVPSPLVRWRRSAVGISFQHRDAQRRSAGVTSRRALSDLLGEPPDESWFWRIREVWDGKSRTLLPGDARRLAALVAHLPPDAARTIWIELVTVVAATLPREAPTLLLTAWQRLPSGRLRLLAPKRVARMLLGRRGLGVGAALRRRFRGY